jgi:hypothetical protein
VLPCRIKYFNVFHFALPHYTIQNANARKPAWVLLYTSERVFALRDTGSTQDKRINFLPKPLDNLREYRKPLDLGFASRLWKQ